MKNPFSRPKKSTPPPFKKTPYTAGLQIAGIAAVTCLICNPNSFLRFANDLPVSTFRDGMLVGAANLSETLKPLGVSGFLQKKRESYFAASKYLRPSVCVATSTQNQGGRSPASISSAITSISGDETATPPSTQSSDKSGKYILLGDSLLKTVLEQEMKSAMKTVTPNALVESVAEVGGGVTRPDIVDWIKTTESFADRGRYDAAFIFLGTNDMQGIHQDGHGYRFGTDSWKKKYVERVKTVLNNLCTYTQKVYWVPPPPVRNEELQRDIKTVTDILSEYIPNYANDRVNFGLPKCVEFVSSYPALAPENHFTAFLQINNEEVKIRERDGIHLTPQGARVLTDYLMKISGLLVPEAKKGST